MRRAADWLVAHQNDDGGWGETCASYMDDALRGTRPEHGVADGVGAARAHRDRRPRPRARDPARRRVPRRAQRDDGTWDEPYYTGTGFPGYGFGERMDFRDERTRERIAQGTELQRGFMINYNLYRHYFPLMALGRARKFLHT